MKKLVSVLPVCESEPAVFLMYRTYAFGLNSPLLKGVPVRGGI